jgi:competence CoiA-like predicted nuclease
MAQQYSIKEVRDSDGRFWTSEEVLQRSQNDINRLRNQCYEAHKLGETPPFVCGYCLQPVWLPATIERVHHFKHFHYGRIDECIYYSGVTAPIEVMNARKYNGAKEGRKHREFKELILQSLNRNPSITDLKLEKVISISANEEGEHKREWRKPDINGVFNNIHFSLELQLSTTWLREIVGRTIFYRKLGYFLLWVFDKFYPEYANRELAYSDVFCNNNENAFVFDQECYELSKTKNDLVLKCYYSKYVKEGFMVTDTIESEIITFGCLTFNHNKKMVYYYDSLGEKKKIEEEIETEMDLLSKESDRQMEELQRNERNKEYDVQIQILQIAIDEKLNILSGIDESIRQTATKIDEEAKAEFDIHQVSSSLITYWEQGEATPDEWTKFVPGYVEAKFKNGISSAKTSFLAEQRDKTIYTKVYSLLKPTSIKKILGQEYVVINTDISLFYLFRESIVSVRRIEIETSILKPVLQKLPNSFDGVFISRKDLIFLMNKKDFDQNKKKLQGRITGLNPILDYSKLINELETAITTTKEEMIRSKQSTLSRHENQKKIIEEELEKLQEEQRAAQNRKALLNSPEVLIF